MYIWFYSDIWTYHKDLTSYYHGSSRNSLWCFISESRAGTWCAQVGGWEEKVVVEQRKRKQTRILMGFLSPLMMGFQLWWWGFSLQEGGALCHGAKHTPGPGVGEPRAGDAVGSGGAEGLAVATIQPGSQRVSANRQELQQCLSQNQLSQQQELGLHFCLPCLGLNWSHEEKVDSGKCSSGLAKWTFPLLPGMFMEEMSKQMQETMLLQAFLYLPHLQSVQEVFSNYVF